MRYIIITKKHLLIGVSVVFALILALIARPLDNITVPTSGSALLARLPIYGVATEQKKIALTFNAAWEADDIPDLLTLLENKNIECTFFMVGDWAKKNPTQARMIAQAGHEIANHSYAHPDMTKLTAEQIKADISKADKAIEEATGVFPKLFRAPSGAYNDTVIATAESLGHIVIQWNVDSLDWKKLTANEITQRVLKKAEAGSIILFHTALKNTRDALPDIIDSFKSKGYSLVKVSDIILHDSYTIDHQGLQQPN